MRVLNQFLLSALALAAGFSVPAFAGTTLSIFAGDGQSATAGTKVTGAVCVVARDSNNNGVGGVSVTWSLAIGAGSITGATQITDSNGIATLGSWTLDVIPGQNTLTASASGLNSLTFTATGVEGPTSMAIASGNNQTATAGSDVPAVVCVVLRDARGSGVSGVSVTWTAVFGGGSITGATQLTDGTGLATLGSWSLGATAGTNTITATSSGLPPVMFTATGVAGPVAAISVAAGNDQTATVGAAVSGPVCAIAKDVNNNPVAGVAITWSGVTGGGSITGATQTTGSSGIATLGSWTLGTTAGTNTLTASTPGLSAIQFSATGAPGPATQMAIAAGNNQIAATNSPVPGVVCVALNDSFNNPVPGVSVTWGGVSGGGSLTGATQNTDANGIATLGGWTLGPSAGTNTITASASGVTSVTFTATAVSATQLAIAAGNNQSALAGFSVPGVVCAIVRDAGNNPVAGIVVTWGNITGGGSITGTTQTTDASGIATLGSWTLGPTPGVNTISASAATLPSITYTATGVGSAPQFISPPSTPAPVIAGQPVALSVAVTSGQVSWNFGDGTSDTGTNTSHAFTAPGVYQVTATVSDGVNSAVETVDVAVNASEPDLSGGSGKLPNKFAILKGAVNFSFAKSGQGRITLAGTLPLPKNFSPNGKSVTVAVGGLEITNLLDARGVAANKTFALRGHMANGVFVDTPGIFTFNVKSADLFSNLQEFGFINGDVRAPGSAVGVPVIVSVDGTSYLASVTFTYTAKAKRTGAGRTTK